jgi:hypothetical protein
MGCDYPGLRQETAARLEELVGEVRKRVEEEPPKLDTSSDPEDKAVERIEFSKKRGGLSPKEYAKANARLMKLRERLGVLSHIDIARKLAEEHPWDSVEYVAEQMGVCTTAAKIMLEAAEKHDRYNLGDEKSFFRYEGKLSDGSEIHPGFSIMKDYLDRKLEPENESILCKHLQECDKCLKQLAYEVVWREKFPDKQEDTKARIIYMSYVAISSFEDAIRGAGDREDMEE